MSTNPQKAHIKAWIRQQALSLGFSECGFLSLENPIFVKATERLQTHVAQGLHGSLDFLTQNHHLRSNPTLLVAGAKTIICVRMDYLHEIPTPRTISDNDRPNHAIIARYARGRDYHKTLRQKLKALARLIENELPRWQGLGVGAENAFIFRPFSDSAPIFEKVAAQAAGLGFEGKHTLLIDKAGGSFFNLGELFVSLDLVEKDEQRTPKALCGSCTACIDICPTRAIIAPYTLDTSACIAYLTIEHQGAIDVKYRKAIGNRVFGCDDCQLICPWNKYAKLSKVSDYAPRHGLDTLSLLDIWTWSEEEFLQKTEGSPLRRTGYLGILRNTAITIGNSRPLDKKSVQHALSSRLGENDILDEHIHWAIAELD
jgi:epoxyqueuosine reductase